MTLGITSVQNSKDCSRNGSGKLQHEGTAKMRLVDSSTGREVSQGEEVEYGRRDYHVSGLDPKTRTVFLFSDLDDASPIPVKAERLGFDFRA